MWFSLGCAAMVTVKLDVASKAFHRCVSMNPDVSLKPVAHESYLLNKKLLVPFSSADTSPCACGFL